MARLFAPGAADSYYKVDLKMSRGIRPKVLLEPAQPAGDEGLHISRKPDRRPRLLVLELWGLGDLTLATTLLSAAIDNYEVTLAGKPHARALLEPAFPQVRFVAYDPPWSVFRGKYRLWKWNWRKLLQFVRLLREARFDVVLSVREDPRDHLIMLLIGARRRLGFPKLGSQMFLTDPIRHTPSRQHKVEHWGLFVSMLQLSGSSVPAPALDHSRYPSRVIDQMLAGTEKPIICFHAGASSMVRRWPVAYVAVLVTDLRRQFDFHLLLIPDPDGYGRELLPMADSSASSLSLPDLVNLLGRIDLLLANDSGPGHIAASCGRPVISIFGPQEPALFRPWGNNNHVVVRDLCTWRPCNDYCKYPEPYCMTKLLPATASEEICGHIRSLIERGVLARRLLRSAESHETGSPKVSPR